MELPAKGVYDASLVTPSRVISRLDMVAYDFGQQRRASCENHPRAAIDYIMYVCRPRYFHSSDYMTSVENIAN